MKPLILISCCAFTLNSCFTASQPTNTPCPACPAPIHDTVKVTQLVTKFDTIQQVVTKTITVDETDTLDIAISDTVRIPDTVTKIQTFVTPIFIDSNASQDVYIHLTPGIPDNSLELQTQIDAIDFNTGTTNIHCHVNHGFFTFKHGILFHNWQQTRGIYFPFTIDFEGDGSAASADGSGTIFNFDTDSTFWIGIQGGKGCKLHGITLEGKWHSQYTTPYQFYSGAGMGALDFRNANYDPAAAIVFEPFGYATPPDGGYPGTDAYGKPWAEYYRGSTNGSTGCEVFDIKFIGTWIGIITSPNGQTANAEAMHFYDLNFDINNANPIVGCQDQEKMNEVGPDIIDWGPTSVFFQAGTYGAHRPGQWIVHGVNIAGWVRQFVYDNTGGYYPIHIYDVFGETLGSFGFLGGQMHNSVEHCDIDFAAPVEWVPYYLAPQVWGMNTTYRDCNFRFYGHPFWPITIVNQDGWNVFDNCGFDCVPVYGNYSGGGQMPFRDCSVGGVHYDSISAGPVPFYGGDPAFQPSYTITDSLVGKYYQATISYTHGELPYLNKVLIAYDLKAVQVGVAGVITAIDPNSKTFTLSYIPPNIISGQQYFLETWKQNLKL